MLRKLIFTLSYLLFFKTIAYSVNHEVTTANDSGPGSLRDLIANASPNDTIFFSNNLINSTILLTSGEIIIDKSVTILGLGHDKLSLSGNLNSRIFNITNGLHAIDIRDLSIINGRNNSATSPASSGGAIYSETSLLLSLKNVWFENNETTATHSQGGAIYAQPFATGYILLDSCSFINCQAKSWGAGVSINGSSDSTLIKDCWFKDNSTETRGGGLFSNSPKLSVINTTFSGNEAEDAAIGYLSNSSSEAFFTNCTFSYNIASDPDRNFRATGDLFFLNCTFTGNNEPIFGYSTLTFQNNIFDHSSANFTPSNNGIYISNGGNISSDNSMVSFLTGTNDLNNTNPLLDVFADNGSIMHTHQLLPGSPAIDNSVNSTSISADQVGTLRDANHDSGAMEHSSCSTVYVTDSITACFSYTWIDGITYTQNNSTATYTYTDANGESCDSIVTLNLTIESIYPDFSYQLTPKCEGMRVDLSTNTSTDLNIQWSNSLEETSTSDTATFLLPYSNNYTMSLELSNNNGCSGITNKTININNMEEYFNFIIPNIFSPNNDGKNDIIYIENTEPLAACSKVNIFNRWGQMIYESNGSFFEWDGKLENGSDVPEGTYFYIIKFHDNSYKGEFTLVR